MNKREQILEQLRDVQLPPAPEGTSVWLIALNLLLLLLVLLGLYRRSRRSRDRWRRDALFQVRQARSMAPATAILALAKLLRQILLYRQQDKPCEGRSWLLHLDAVFDTRWFSEADGQVFGDALYQPTDMDDDELQDVCTQLEQLIRKLPSGSSVPLSARDTQAVS